ncbi:succinyl-CoA synthetase beta subunit [Methylohalomonas lacus]|uniref:Succinate--CoA ligase [ADP-forming] subunit beta n=1 Tax=Methylohalomonas lacus TaxID=398773 RepID=A0AAE3L4H4_9GAMM|nr:ADP-forming succinate--CoA ligase subunit beta [Methylohalomonas lacus]MCS3903878.1 succinyl-CoA synthetase beta subunit [Methylohalomonas lacus]
MNLHEYQAKLLFAEYGIPVPAGKPAHSVKEALRHAHDLRGSGWIVKAQVYAGGRGKAGGVQMATSIDEVENHSRRLLGQRLVTQQSGPKGQPVNCLLIEKRSEIQRELYLGMLVDRASRRIAVIASSAGGMDIETVAANQPEQIFRLTINPVLGLQDYQSRRIGFALELDADQREQLRQILRHMYRLFLARDLSLIEINPLIVDDSNNLVALDAKITLDDNALMRQPELAEWHDPTQEDERESIARRFDLNYVTLDGNIACMVNGAGLAMATMDIIKLYGGEPANFLDVGGGATADKVAEAFKLITSDDNVRAILVNIFGGIVRCDLIADGIIQAVREVGVNVPIIARLEGTNVDEGKAKLKDSGLNITAADDLGDAAQKAVAAVR